MAWVHQDLGDYASAKALYEESLRLLEELNLPADLANTLGNLGALYYLQGDHDLALERYFRGIKLRRELPAKDRDSDNNQFELAQLLYKAGLVYAQLGEYAQAARYYEESRERAQSAGREAEGLLLNIGKIHEWQGNDELALEFYLKDLAVSERKGFKPFMIQDWLNIGLIRQRQNRVAEAMENLHKALALSTEIGHKDFISKAQNLLGLALHQQKDYAQAPAYYQKSLALRRELNDKEGIADTSHNLALIHAGQGDLAGALGYAEPAGALAKQIGKRELIWRIYTTLGRIYLTLNQPDKAKPAFDEAIKVIEEMRANLVGGELQAQSFFENKTAPYIGIADLLLAQNKKEEALSYAEQAKARVLLDVLQSGRVNVTKAMTAAEQDEERRLRSEMVSFNTRLNREQTARQPDEKRISELRAGLQRLQHRYEDFQVSLYARHPELKAQRGEASPLTLAQAAELLPNDKTALLSFVMAEERTLLFALTRPAQSGDPQLNVYSLPLKSETIAERVSQFRKKLAENRPGFRDESRELYRMLLERAQPQLRGVTRLVISPDGPLWELPFQALITEKRNYLLEEYAVAYAPSLTVLREMAQARRNRPARSEPAALLAVGDPTLGPEAASRYKALMNEPLNQIPEARRQVQSLSKFYDQPKVYIGDEATEAQVKTDAGQSGVVHLAAHGVLDNRNPMHSYIVLAQNAGQAKELKVKEAEREVREDGLLEAWEIMKMDLNADLVALSACETARGRVSAGEGMIGLTWALFVAGAPTTVVSQWAVRSDSTAELMVRFHRQLRQPPRSKGKPAAPAPSADALRLAALELMKNSNYSHPFHWAGFVVMGNGFDNRAGGEEQKATSKKRPKGITASR
jgi:CHAT domain-containing protein/Tfp pilus assembly protein PilF